MDEFYTRAMLVQNRVEQLASEAARAPLERLDAIHHEMLACEASLCAIREEQLIAMLPKAKRPKRRWFWRRRR